MFVSVSKSRNIFTNLKQLISSCKYSTTLNPRVRLCEVPGVCSSEEWYSVVRESSVALQNIVSRNHIQRDDVNTLPIETVIRKLQQSSHNNNNYLIETFRQLLSNSEANSTELRWPGLITLMLSSGLGNPFEFNDFVSKSLEDVVWSSQITLAEIVNLLYCNFLFQKENQRLISSKRTEMRSATLDNEIDRLINYYFTSSVLRKISSLRNSKVLFLMAKVLESFATTKSSIYAGSRPIHNLKSWEYDAFYPQGLLLAAGCQSALELAGHNEKVQEQAFEFGSCFTLAIKANADIQQLWNYQTSHSSFINISSFPVALHLSNNPETLAYLYSCSQTLLNLDYNELNTILMNNAAMDEARRQLTVYVEKATNILEEFENFKNYEIIELLLKLVGTLGNVRQ